MYRPILFRAEMIRQLLAGTKTQTRRAIKSQPPVFAGTWSQHKQGDWGYDDKHPDLWYFRSPSGKENVIAPIRCPYGTVGDRLWTRETFVIETNRDVDDSEAYPPPFTDRPVNWCTDADGATYWEQCHYRATDPTPELAYGDTDEPTCRWRPSIFMPRWASRLTLELTAVRIERLGNISELDCEAELGVPPHRLGNDAYRQFVALWERINRRFDPALFVWVLTFQRVQP